MNQGEFANLKGDFFGLAGAAVRIDKRGLFVVLVTERRWIERNSPFLRVQRVGGIPSVTIVGVVSVVSERREL
ncbi:MAG: hypothetical protein RL215_2314 [Planctomycetota bacterium]